MSYYKDLVSDLDEITKIVFEIGKTNKFNHVDFKKILEIAKVIYEEYEENLHIDIRIFARIKLKEIIELVEKCDENLEDFVFKHVYQISLNKREVD